MSVKRNGILRSVWLTNVVVFSAEFIICVHPDIGSFYWANLLLVGGVVNRFCDYLKGR